MLSELASYACGHGLDLEPGFAAKSARWSIWLDGHGEFVDVLDLRADQGDRVFRCCPDLQQPELIAGGITRSHFLLDTVSVVTLSGTDAMKAVERRKIQAKHEYFVMLLDEAGQTCPALSLCASFLRNEANLQTVRAVLAARKAKGSDKITFRADEDFPVDTSDWHPWWKEFRTNLGSREEHASQGQMRCLQTGELVSPMRTHPKIKGLTGVGGPTTGCVLIGFDKEAFTSYGLEQSGNAAVSETAAAIYASALNDLVPKAGRPVAGTLCVHWFKQAVAAQDDPLEWVKGALGDGGDHGEVEALQHARKLLEGITTGTRADMAGNTFHAVILSATGGRVMVRDWLEGNFAQLARNVLGWFEDLSICTRDGMRLARAPGLPALMFSLVRKNMDEVSPSVAVALWRAALFGRPVPRLAVAAALRRIRVEIVDPDKVASSARMGLIKAYHVREAISPGGDGNLTPYLNEDHPSSAYQAGRLMAVLAAVQRAALGDVGAGIVQRYYAAVSTTPALVLGRLVRQSQFHLNKLDRGLAIWYEGVIAVIMGHLGDRLPVTLDLEGQSLFALGYYQQLAALYHRRQADNPKEDAAHE